MAGVEIDQKNSASLLMIRLAFCGGEYFKPSMTDWWDNTVTPAIKDWQKFGRYKNNAEWMENRYVAARE